jgi:1-acyl-sn-glycerol-3-phosphate acyltransferase
MKSFNEFTEIIARHDTYSTPPDAKGKNLFGPSLKFYLKMAEVVLYSNLMVRKNIYNEYNWVYSSLDILHGTEKAGIKYEIEGMNNITSVDGPVIFISNHMSTLETLTLPGIIHPVKKIVFITKKELTSYPFFGPINSARDPIIVGRKNPREDLKLVFEEGAEKINNGKSIVVFPQRTRSARFNPKHFNTLGAKLAKQNKIPIIPITLLTDCWENGKFIKELGPINIEKTARFKFGKSISPDDPDAHEKIIEFIKENLRNWGAGGYIVDS